MRKHWPSAPAPVLDDVGLEVSAGECIAVTGRNGAGKTTLLRIAAGLIIPDAGDVRIGGLDLERDRTACQRRIGFLSAGNTGLYARLSVERAPRLLGAAADDPASTREARRSSSVIERFELARALRPPRRPALDGAAPAVRLALAFLHGPVLVLLDEPRSSLDEEGAALLRDAVLERVAARRRGRRVRAERRRGGHRVRPRARRPRRSAGDGMTRARAYLDAAVGDLPPRLRAVRELPDALRHDGLHHVREPDALLLRVAARARRTRVGARTADEYYAFVVIGIVIFGVLTSTLSLPLATLRAELLAGTFERMVLSPFGAVRCIASLLIFPRRAGARSPRSSRSRSPPSSSGST